MTLDLSTRTLRHEELPSGTVYGYVLPDVPRMKMAGGFPTAIVPLINDYLRNPIEFVNKELDDAELAQWSQFQCELVAWMVREVDSEPASLDADDLGDPERFPIDDRESLFTAGLRIRPRPKATSAEAFAKGYLEERGWTLTKTPTE